MTTVDDGFDMADTLKAKSDQLNAADIIGGPITVQITGGSRTKNEQQPILFKISGGHMPWKPCKTMRRLMSDLAGTTKGGWWFGRWIVLYRDPEVTYGDKETGGIRLGAVSGLDEERQITLMTRRNQYTTYTIRPLTPPGAPQGKPTANLDALLAESNLTREDADRWLASKSKPLLAGRTPESVAELAGWLAANSVRLEEIRKLIPAKPADPEPASTATAGTDEPSDGDGSP